MRMKYPQLDSAALALLTRRVSELGGSRAAVAAELGVGRTSVSQAIDGKYPGDTCHLRAKIMARYADLIACPVLGPIPPRDCATYRERPLAACSANPASVSHWRACRVCINNPAAQGAAA